MPAYYIEDVKRFHDKFQLETPPFFCFLPKDLLDFRVKFFHEELTEYEDAVRDGDLATAIDSLVDLVYIICGAALLHGIDPKSFYKALETFEPDSVMTDLFGTETASTIISFMPEHCSESFVKSFKDRITNYAAVGIHEPATSKDIGISVVNELSVELGLARMYLEVLGAASMMGLTEQDWQDFWDDVQRANMSKVRAEKASDSKRGSKWDVVKPAGWVGPDTEGLLKRKLEAAESKYHHG